MSDATFYLLDALLNAARGMVVTQRAKTVQLENNLQQDPRSTVARVGTHPASMAVLSFIGNYLLNKHMTSYAKNPTPAR